jgi:hypothetical protein
MARTRTRAQIRARARVLADAVGSTNTTDAEANVEIDEALAELDDMLTAADPKRKMRRSVLTAVANQREYDLAAGAFSPSASDFVSVVSVKYLSSTDSNEVPLSPFNFHEKTAARGTGVNTGEYVRYDVYYSGVDGADARLVFDGDPEPGARYALYYVRATPSLSTENSTYDGINGWEEYAALKVAIVIKDRMEGDTSSLERRLAVCKQRITTMAPQRDSGRSGVAASVWQRDNARRRPAYR